MQISKTFSEIAENGQKYGVNLPSFLKRLRIWHKNSEFREQFQNSRYMKHATNGQFYKSKWTTVICNVHLIKVN